MMYKKMDSAFRWAGNPSFSLFLNVLPIVAVIVNSLSAECIDLYCKHATIQPILKKTKLDTSKILDKNGSLDIGL